MFVPLEVSGRAIRIVARLWPTRRAFAPGIAGPPDGHAPFLAGWQRVFLAGAEGVARLFGSGQPGAEIRRLKPVYPHDRLARQGRARRQRRILPAPAGRRQGVAFINKLSSVHNGTKEIDSQCGFRAISKKAAGTVSLEHDGFAGGAELVLSAQHAGLRVVEVPVHVKYFSEKNNPFAQGAGLVDYVAGQLIRKNPLALFAGVGAALLALSALLGVFVVDTFYSRHELATGSAFLTVFFGIAGMIMVLIGLNLYTLKKVLEARGKP